MPARFAAVTTFCAAVPLAVTTCTRTSTFLPISPAGSCTPGWPSRMNSCGKQVQRFAVFGQRNAARLLDRGANVVAADLARARAERDAAVAVDAANVRSGDADDGVLDRRLGDVLGLFDRFLDRVDRLVEIGDHAFAHAARVGDAVAAIAKSVLVDFGDDDAGLGASDVNHSEQVFRLTSHCVLVLLRLLRG